MHRDTPAPNPTGPSATAAALAAALLSANLSAQTPPFTTDWLALDPTTEILDLSSNGGQLVDGALLDLDEDGRVDLALLGSSGELGVVRDFDGHPRTLPFDASAMGIRDLAAMERDGRDALLTAGPGGLHVVEWQTGAASATSLRLLEAPLERVLYARGAGQTGSVVWVVHEDMVALQALLVDSATGALLEVGPELLLPSAIGAAEPIDVDGDGRVELAITWHDGLIVIDALANPLGLAARAMTGSSIAGDALVRLVDDQGSESLAWIERDGSKVSIATVSHHGTHRIAIDDTGWRCQTAMDFDLDGLADLVLGGANGQGVRVFQAQSGPARYDDRAPAAASTALPPASAPTWSTPAHFAVADVDRDGDDDLVRIGSQWIDVARSTRIDASSLAPSLVDESVVWTFDAVEGHATHVQFQLDAPPTNLPGARVVLSLHAGHSPNRDLHSDSEPATTVEVVNPSWPLTFDLTLPPVYAVSTIWYVEARLVGGPSVDHEYPALVVALTSNAAELVSDEVTDGGSLWRLPFGEVPFMTFGQGTTGSVGELRIPRLPPPPPPPPTPITPITSPTPTGGD
jgi:hypothetical protein